MKRVDNSDVNIKLDSRIVYLSNFNAKFYTVNAENFFIRKTQDNVISAETDDNDTEYYIKLDWNELVTLGEGVLQYKITNNIPDFDRADLVFNKNLERTTEYYINSNVTVDPETEESLSEVIAELGVKIDTEIARSTSADTVHDVAIQDEVITRQQNVSDLTDLITSNVSALTTAIDAEITRAEGQEIALNGLISSNTQNILEISGNTYTKTEVDDIVSNIDVTEQLNNYVTLSAFTYTTNAISGNVESLGNYTERKVNELSGAVDTKVSSSDFEGLANYTEGKITALSGAIDTKVSSSDFEGLANYTEGKITALSGAIDTKLDASAYTPTDLTSYYTKSETDNVVDGETSRAVSAETALNGLICTNTQNISTISGNTYTKTEVYTKSEVDNAILQAQIGGVDYIDAGDY